jgi:cardiolipin synthase A/B
MNDGISSTQPPQSVAQKLSRTTLPRKSERRIFLPSFFREWRAGAEERAVDDCAGGGITLDDLSSCELRAISLELSFASYVIVEDNGRMQALMGANAMTSILRSVLFMFVALPIGAQTTTNSPLLTFPDATFTPVYTFINSATKTLDMTMYELVDTTAEQDLGALAAKGVAVRVILDQNSEKSSNTTAYTYLTAHGVQVHWANPAYAVTHQKTITVDGASSMILTANLTSRYYTTTRDFSYTDTDATDVAEIERVFGLDFTNATVTPAAADDLIWSPNLARAGLLAVINGATKTLQVENEEMSDATIVDALVARAKAGIAVTVIMTNDDDHYAGEFSTLTAGGVAVYTYPDTATALYIHAKVILADAALPAAVAYVGSINFSVASETENRELGLTTTVPAVLKSLNTTLTSDAAGGTLYTATTSSSRGY